MNFCGTTQMRTNLQRADPSLPETTHDVYTLKQWTPSGHTTKVSGNDLHAQKKYLSMRCWTLLRVKIFLLHTTRRCFSNLICNWPHLSKISKVLLPKYPINPNPFWARTMSNRSFTLNSQFINIWYGDNIPIDILETIPDHTFFRERETQCKIVKKTSEAERVQPKLSRIH